MVVVAMATMTLMMIKEISRSSSCSPAWPPRPPAPRSCQRSPLPLCGIAPCQQPCDSIVITMIMVAMKMVGMVMLLMVMMTITPGSTLVTFTPVPANSFLRLSLMPDHHCPSSSSPKSTSHGKGKFFLLIERNIEKYCCCYPKMRHLSKSFWSQNKRQSP